MREFERFDERAKIWEIVEMKELLKGNSFRVRDDGNLVKADGFTEFIAIGSPYKNKDGIFQIDYVDESKD